MWDFITSHSMELLGIVTGLNIVAGLVARFTKNKTDDHVVAVIGRILGSVGSLGAKPVGSVKPKLGEFGTISLKEKK